MSELAGKVAVVTGGAKGIGATLVEVLLEEGAQVLFADVDEPAGAALAARLGERARFRCADVSRREDVQALVDTAVQGFGQLDVMINNAAITGAFHERFLDDDLADLEQVLQVNLAGVMYGCQSAGRHMRERGAGSIINISSIAAQCPGYAITAYRAAKAGVVNLTRSLAIDLGEYGIRVNAISPGSIATGMGAVDDAGLEPGRAAALAREMDAAWLVNQPLKRRGSPRDVAHAAVYFASDRSAYVTGQVLGVDGGGSAGEAINRRALLTQTRERFLSS